ncbi:glutamyl-tRNA reductase [Oscillospiraceae bacterium WX1]
MNICMAGIDFNKASIEYRERFALTKTAQAAMLGRVGSYTGVSGCVIISTCNRMELWTHHTGTPKHSPFDILCELFHIDAADYEKFFTCRVGNEAVRHLFELAAGLKSLIFGEEQILAQVKEAIDFARASRSSDPVLDSLFRRAVTAAKKAKTAVRLTPVDCSAAMTAVEILKEKFSDLNGLPCLVIGSGEMGRLAAESLVGEGADVTVTLRQYSNGATTAPPGCRAIDYEARYSLLGASAVIISATRSPHYTLLYDDAKTHFTGSEKMLFDLAVPRDIDPQIGVLPYITLYDIDHLGGSMARGAENAAVGQVLSILDAEIAEFDRWRRVRSLMPKITELGVAASTEVSERIRHNLRHVSLDDSARRLVHNAAGQAVSKVVENILLSLEKNTDDELFASFISDMQDEAALKPMGDTPPNLPPRFPLFLDLSGKEVVVVGAGPVACRRIKSLLSYPCRITVIAPDVHEDIKVLHQRNEMTLYQKTYEPRDLENAFLVIAATDSRSLNHQIALDAEKAGQHCSIADCKEECSFFFPATVHYNGGVIGICGTGDNHTRTKNITDDIREFIKTREQL